MSEQKVLSQPTLSSALSAAQALKEALSSTLSASHVKYVLERRGLCEQCFASVDKQPCLCKAAEQELSRLFGKE